MKAVILAAGLGIRFGNQIVPKCLLKLNGKTILGNQIEILNSIGITDIIVVIGSQGECWTKENQETIKAIHSNVIINLENKIKNATYSLKLALENISQDDLLILDGDLAFRPESIKKILESNGRVLVVQEFKEQKPINRVKLSNEKVLGVGKHIQSDFICMGMMKTEKEDFNLLKEILDKGDYLSDLSFLMDGLCKNKDMNYIIAQNMININTKEDLKEAEEFLKN